MISHRLQFYFLKPPAVEFLTAGAANAVFQCYVGHFLTENFRRRETAREDQTIISPFCRIQDLLAALMQSELLPTILSGWNCFPVRPARTMMPSAPSRQPIYWGLAGLPVTSVPIFLPEISVQGFFGLQAEISRIGHRRSEPHDFSFQLGEGSGNLGMVPFPANQF